ncbi:MAG: AlpA family transcriptional regulator [Ghiorsea sp.]
MKNYQKVKQLAACLHVSESTIWRWVAVGKLPKPFRPTQRTTLFDVEKCQAAIDKMAGEA